MNLSLTTLAALSALTATAQANTVDWQQHDLLELAASVTPIGAFEDTYRFTLDESHALFSTAVSNNLTSVLGLTDGLVTLVKEAGATDVDLGSFAFNESTGSISHSFGAALAGDYYYRVTGSGTGSFGGFYTLSSTLGSNFVNAVPEPQTYALMLAGLGAGAFLTLRRRG